MSEAGSLTGEVAIVASEGPSERDGQIARVLAAAGARVVHWTPSLTGAEDDGFVIEVEPKYRRETKAALQRSVEKIGPPSVLVVCMHEPSNSIFLDRSLTDISESIVSASLCFFNVVQEVGEALIGRGGGAVVNVLCSGTLRGERPDLCRTASRGAIEHLTRSLANEWARHGVRVNAVAPGPSPTGLSHGEEVGLRSIPLRRLPEADEIGRVAAFLASDQSSYVTGAVWTVDGGASVKL